MIKNEPLTPEGRFEYAFNDLMKDEGGYSNQVLDDGGPTNFGITQKELTRTYHDLRLPLLVKNLSIDDAKRYYKIEWWDKYHCDAINSLAIASKFFNMAVNMGPIQATRIIQRTLNMNNYDIDEDGIMGPTTISTINELSNETYLTEADFMHLIILQQTEFYEWLVHKNPDLQIFLNGWINRAKYSPS
jgi:lysozyme family protein